jgi:hypothetical protein
MTRACGFEKSPLRNHTSLYSIVARLTGFRNPFNFPAKALKQNRVYEAIRHFCVVTTDVKARNASTLGEWLQARREMLQDRPPGTHRYTCLEHEDPGWRDANRGELQSV